MGRPGLHPDLARLVMHELPAVIPPAWVGEPHTFPSLAGTQFAINGDARTVLAEGPTPLEAFLPFEVASPLSRIYLVLLPLLVIIFPLWTLVRATWAWFMRGRITNWYPRIHAIEREIDTASLPKLEADREFLGTLASQLAKRTRVPAGYGGAYYDLRVDVDLRQRTRGGAHRGARGKRGVRAP
jgi:hypothetical protein